MIAFIDRLPRRGKQICALFADAFVLGLSMWAALAIRLESFWPDLNGHSLVKLCLWAIAVGLPCCYGFGLYREVTRYVGLRFAMRVGYTVTTIALVVAFVEFMNDRANGLPRSAILIFWMLSILGIGGARAVARYVIRSTSQRMCSRTLVYGAGDVGAGLVSMLTQDQRTKIIGFIDDDPKRVGTQIRSLSVYSSENVRKVVRIYAPILCCWHFQNHRGVAGENSSKN